MKTIEEAAIEYNDSISAEGRAIREAFKASAEFAQRWIPIEEELPEYEQSVLVKRPNKYSGKTDTLLAKLHKAKEAGAEYGNGMGGGYPKTYKDYWSLPAIVLLNTITHWRPIELK